MLEPESEPGLLEYNLISFIKDKVKVKKKKVERENINASYILFGHFLFFPSATLSHAGFVVKAREKKSCSWLLLSLLYQIMSYTFFPLLYLG